MSFFRKTFSRSVPKVFIVAMLCSSVFPAGVQAAAIPVVPGIVIDYDGFRLKGGVSYGLVAGQPTAVGKIQNGAIQNYPDGACVPIQATVQNPLPITSTLVFHPSFEYFAGAIGGQDLEAIATSVAGNPRTNATNLDQFTLANSPLSSAVSFPSSAGVVGAAVSGPFGGNNTGTTATGASDASRHYNITLSGVSGFAQVYVIFCLRLGANAHSFTGTNINARIASQILPNVSIQKSKILSLPSLTLSSVVNSGAATADQWSFDVAPAINGVSHYTIASGQTSVVIPAVPPEASYSVTETGPAGYAFTSGSGTNCSFSGATATATPTPGKPAKDASCTFTNDAVLPLLTVNKVVVNDNGGTNVVTDFPLFVDQTSVISGASNAFQPGDHTVSETNLPNYVGTFSGDCDSNGLVVLAYGDSKVCTLTNDDVPTTLTVRKIVVNDNGGTKTVSDFPLFIDGNAVVSDATTTVSAGDHVVTETSDPGYVGTFSGDCDADGHVTAVLGQAKVCILTNDDQQAQLTVIKNVVNDNGGKRKPKAFTINVTGVNASPATFKGSAAGTVVTLDAGNYSVAEKLRVGYAPSYSTDCTGTLLPGDKKTCTITNDDKQAQLTVIKHVINDDGGTKVASDFTLDVAGNKVSQTSFAGSEDGVVVTLDKGKYSVTEEAAAGYTTSYSKGCVGRIGLGRKKTCTVTNNDIPVVPPPLGTLTIIKHLINNNGGTASAADFGLAVDQDGVNINNVTGAEDPGVTISVPAGNYNVSEIVDESSPAGYTATYSVDCSGTIADGDAKTCTVTNDDQPAQLTVIKTVNNTHGGTRVASDFVMDVTGGNVSTPSFNGDAAGTVVTLDAGDYSVDESATLSDGETSNDYVKSLDGGCEGTLAPGATATCTVTNNDPAPATGTIHVIKTVVNDDGGTRAAGDFTMHATAANPSTNDFAGSAEGTDVTVDVGDYSIDEGAHDGYTETRSEGCSGTMTAGATIDCTITNDDIASNDGGGGGFTATTGTIVIIKHVINDNGGTHTAGDFTMLVTATNPSQSSLAGSENGTSVTVDAGSYSVNESDSVRTFDGEGTVPNTYVKTIGEGCSGSIAAGQTVTCTITNNDPGVIEEGDGTGTLVIKTFVVNTNGGLKSSSDFTSTVTGSGVSSSTTQGDAAGVSVTLNAGEYSVAQTAAFGYTQGLGADCSGSIADGQTKTCEITERDPASGSGSGGNGGGGGGGGGVIASGPAANGGGSAGGPSSPAPRVLGEEFTNILAGACTVTETEAPLITTNADDLARILGKIRDTSLEQRYLNSLVPLVTATSTDPDIRLEVTNFTTYGTLSSLHLGAGERAGVVDSFRAVFGRVPKSLCDWQMALRISKSLIPGELNPAREKMMESVFKQIWKRAPDRTKPVDNLAILMMTYGLRPAVRNLPAERNAIRSYRKIFGHNPHGATAWDTMRAIAYSGEPTP